MSRDHDTGTDSGGSNTGTRPQSSPPLAIVLAVVGSVLLAGLANAVVALLTHAAFEVSSAFSPLQPPAYLLYTSIGVVLAAAVWLLLRRFARNPRGILRWLAPAVVLLSLVPDVLILAFPENPAITTTPAVLALMVMHVVTAVIAVPMFARFLPLPRRTPTVAAVPA